jgi:hypothetical protein
MRNMNLSNLAHPSKFSFLLPFAAAAVACILTLESGCAFLSPLKSPKRTLVDCYAKALMPVAGEVFDAAELAKDLVQGKADLGALLHNLQATDEEALALAKALNACIAPPAALPSGSAS